MELLLISTVIDGCDCLLFTRLDPCILLSSVHVSMLVEQDAEPVFHGRHHHI